MMNFLRENKPELNIGDKEGDKAITVLFYKRVLNVLS